MSLKGQHSSLLTEWTKENNPNRLKLLDDSWYPIIPSLCECPDHNCREIVYGGRKYIKGHQRRGKEGLRGDKSVFKRPEVRNKIKEYRTGRKSSKETRKKQSEIKIGIHPPLKTRQKMSNSSNPDNRGRFKKGDPKLSKRAIELQELYRLNPELHPNRIMGKKGFVSKPQKKLFELLKLIYLDAELEYPIKTLRRNRFADIGIPSLKLDFELDGVHWHKDSKIDLIRQKEIEDVGWKVIRFTDKEKLLLELIKLKLSELT